MRSSQRLRIYAMLVVLGVLVTIYISHGSSSTHDSEFYKKTVSLMDAKARNGGPALLRNQNPEPGRRAQRQLGMRRPKSGSEDEESGNSIIENDEPLRSRLKEAEEAAKRSADDKYRHLQDIQNEVAKDRQTRQAPLGSDAKPTSRKSSDDDNVVSPGHLMNDRNRGALLEQSIDEMEPTDTQARSQATVYPISNKEDDDVGSEDEDPEVENTRRLLASILHESPVVVFSKSYCPFSAKAKHILLSAYTLTPPPFIVELDKHPQGVVLQELLRKTTGRRTVPNVLVNGKTIGGGDEMEMLWKSGELPARIKQIAGRRVESVKLNFKFGEQGQS